MQLAPTNCRITLLDMQLLNTPPEIQGEILEVVERFTYLGSCISSDCSVTDGVNAQICKAPVALANLRHLWRQRGISLNLKGRTYQTGGSSENSQGTISLGNFKKHFLPSSDHTSGMSFGTGLPEREYREGYRLLLMNTYGRPRIHGICIPWIFDPECQCVFIATTVSVAGIWESVVYSQELEAMAAMHEAMHGPPSLYLNSKITTHSWSERQPLNDKDKTDPGNLVKILILCINP
ncbi:hypothetical protein T265_10809 [Opisthorchis viverrini]|uniref:Uncharacterized protein n=1 Tax=Opisthorchis viverrini TaxID=6198 RepID=A0A074ZZX9_OPIVI|nr:hypothetical protein T265_10809 [Opisthorchis viverrini]KER20694.1 hypothetical protein T265_10809 [Opisthorchis viverrini]